MESPYAKTQEQIHKLRAFANRHDEIYIYGAGKYGKICYEFLQRRDIHINGFITTDGGGKVLGKTVYKAAEILGLLPSSSGIILAVNTEHQEEIRNHHKFTCDILCMSSEMYRYFRQVAHWDEVLSKYKRPAKRDFCVDGWEKILMIQLEVTFGDMVWSTALYRELRRNFPNSQIILIMNPKLMDLYHNCPYINRIVPYECDTLLEHVSDEAADKTSAFMRDNFGDTVFDAVFLPRLLPSSDYDSWENVLLALASNAKYRIGHSMYFTDQQRYICDVASELFTVVVKHMEEHMEVKHEVLHNLEMLTACGCPYKDDRMELWVDQTDKGYADIVLNGIPDKTLLIAVALVGRDPRRSWDSSRYRNVFHNILKKYPNRVVFILCGGNDAAEAAATVQDGQSDEFINLTGKTSLTEAAAVISRCHLYIGSDTGLMHMAASFGIPVIEICAYNKAAPDYYGSSPTRTGPWKVDSIILQPEKPLDNCVYMCCKSYAHCINQIEESQVEKALEEMISCNLCSME